MPILFPAAVVNLPTPFWAEYATDENGDVAGIDVEEVTNAWDQCALDGMVVPGICDVAVSPRLKTNAAKAQGRDGGPTFLLGLEPVKVEINVTIWHPDQWKRFLDLIAKVFRKANKASPKEVKAAAAPKKAPKIEDDGGVGSIGLGAAAAEIAGTAGALQSALSAGAGAAAAEAAVTGPVPKKKTPSAQLASDPVREAAVFIQSSATAMFHIYAIVITGIDSPRPTSAPGARVIKISALEYIAPSTRTATARVTAPRTTTNLNTNLVRPKNGAELRPSQTDNTPALKTPSAPLSPVTR